MDTDVVIMNFTFDTRIILLISCLLQGLASLRLVKVSIPAYKLRGESAFLECQYELNRPHDTTHMRNRHHQQGGDSGDESNNDMNYVDTDSTGDDRPVYRRLRRYSSYQLQEQLQQQQQQQQQYHQERVGNVYYQQHEPQPHQYPTHRSPYGHSVYRGRSAYPFGVQVGASTHTGSTYTKGAEAERDNSESRDAEPYDVEDTEEEEEEEDGEALYAIKWYKDNEEFYRFVPKANPTKTSYRVDGVRVIEEHSDSSRVFLRGLTLNSTGQYRCEVSAEAPNFSSVQGEGRMDIVFLPRDGPHIKGQQFQYQIGEIINLNCTSGKSHPASHLQWFINEQAVLDGRYLIPYNDTVHKHGLITSTLGLQFTVDGHHFYNGAMRVKCLASISPVLWKGGKESVVQRRPGIIDNREAMLLVRSSAPSKHQGLLENSLRVFATTTVLMRICQLLLSIDLT